MKDYYFYLSSDDYKRSGFRDTNSPHDFIIDLKDTITLPDDEYECSLIDYAVIKSPGGKNMYMYVFCDLVRESYVKEQYLPILKQIDLRRKDSITCNYVKMNVNQFNKIRIYIRDRNMTIRSLGISVFTCTLHVRPRKK